MDKLLSPFSNFPSNLEMKQTKCAADKLKTVYAV